MVTADTWPPQPRARAFDGDVDLERDRKLVDRAQAGDKAAFDALYELYFARLERYCMRRLNDGHEAQDVAQEAFLRAWRALPSFGGERRFFPWVSVIASNLCTDSLRKKQRFGPVPVADLFEREVAAGDSTEESAMALAELDLAAQAYSHLSDRHRRVLDLRERSGLSYQAIADREGLQLTTVETLIWRARQAFKREFSALTGSDGRLGGVAVVGAVEVGLLRRLFKALGSVPSRMASIGPQGFVATLGGAVATAAIVVASSSGAPHSVQTPKSAQTAPIAQAVGPQAGLSPPSRDSGYGRNVSSGTLPSSATSATTAASGSTGTGSGGAPAVDSGTGNGEPKVSNQPAGVRDPGTELGDVGDAGGAGTGGVSKLGGTVKGVKKEITGDLGGLLGNAKSTLGSAARSLTQTVGGAEKEVGSAAESVGNVVGPLGSGIEDAAKSLLGGGSSGPGSGASGPSGGATPGLLGGSGGAGTSASSSSPGSSSAPPGSTGPLAPGSPGGDGAPHSGPLGRLLG